MAENKEKKQGMNEQKKQAVIEQLEKCLRFVVIV